jgi:hypothetical protein
VPQPGRHPCNDVIADANDRRNAIRQCRKLADKTPLMLQGSAHAVQELDCTIDRAEAPSQRLDTGNVYPTVDLC